MAMEDGPSSALGMETKDEPSRLTPFGTEMRKMHFLFAEEYRPLNHGSFGACPKEVRNYQRQLQDETEAGPDTFIRYTYPKLLKESREAIAPLLGLDSGEVVFIPNATTGVNTVLHNLSFKSGNVILYFSTIYGACEKTIQSLSEDTPVEALQIDIDYPSTDDSIILDFNNAVQTLS